MSAYSLVDIREIKDAAKMEEYKARVTPVVEKFGDRYLVIGGPFEVVEGSYQPLFPVLIQFPTTDEARRWYDSEEYAISNIYVGRRLFRMRCSWLGLRRPVSGTADSSASAALGVGTTSQDRAGKLSSVAFSLAHSFGAARQAGEDAAAPVTRSPFLPPNS